MSSSAFFCVHQDIAGSQWQQMYQTRLQHALSRRNHHIHPLVDALADPETGERRSLQSCRPKGSKRKQGMASQACKAGFPLVHELTEEALIVCDCIAQHRNLPSRGPRSMLGDVLPARNDAWLNAGPRAFIAFTADNADVKFTLRLPILKETHEVLPTGVRMHPMCGKNQQVSRPATCNR